VGPECQGSTGAAHGEKEIDQHNEEDGPPLADRASSPAYTKPPGPFLDKSGFSQDVSASLLGESDGERTAMQQLGFLERR
jgi:hypothetical protein